MSTSESSEKETLCLIENNSESKEKITLSLNEKTKELLVYANKSRKSSNGLFCDFQVQIGNDKCFPCNKMVLACYSTYFERLFQTRQQEQLKCVDLPSSCENGIEIVLDYLHGEQITIDNVNALDVLSTSDYLEVDDVRDFCFSFLTKNFTKENCLDILIAHKSFKPDFSTDHICYFVCEHFDEISQQKRLKNLYLNQITSLLMQLIDIELNQESIFTSIAHWTSHQYNTRKEYFSFLFELLDLSKMSLEFLVNVVSVNPLVMKNIECLNLVSIEQSKILKRQLLDQNSKIICLGGKKQGEVMEVHNIFGKSKYPDLPADCSWHCVEKVLNFIYSIGGLIEHAAATDNVYRMDLNEPELKWSEVASMKQKRSYFASSVFKENIVVSGGYNRAAGHKNSVESYAIHENEWKVRQAMNICRSGHSMVVCDGNLYAIGGSNNEDKYLRSVEKLQELDGSWEFIKGVMNFARNRASAVCLKGVIYVIGGHFDKKQREKTVEKFVPEEGSWDFVKSMNIARSGSAACVYREKIFVVGGEHGKASSTMECYDPTTDVWSIVNDRICSLEGHDLVVL